MTKQSAHVTIRPAIETDEVAIRTLVHSERLNPYGLDWPNFMVAVIGPVLVGAVQLRRHLDGSRELGSLVVRKEARRRGIASRLIDALLAGTNERVLLITVEAFAARYERWGFRPIEPAAAPAAIRRSYRLGSLASVTALLKFRRIRRLVILHRDESAPLHSPVTSVVTSLRCESQKDSHSIDLRAKLAFEERIAWRGLDVADVGVKATMLQREIAPADHAVAP